MILELHNLQYANSIRDTHPARQCLGKLRCTCHGNADRDKITDKTTDTQGGWGHAQRYARHKETPKTASDENKISKSNQVSPTVEDMDPELNWTKHYSGIRAGGLLESHRMKECSHPFRTFCKLT